MARVPNEELERIKREISIVRLVEARGVKLSGSGDNLMGLCPNHDDKTPSLVVSPTKNIFHCLGACQRGGSVIDWVMLSERVSFRLAVEMLLRDAPSLDADRPQPNTRAKLEPLATTIASDAELMRRAVEHYHATYKASPEAQAYLASRGLVDAEMVDRFKLGFANRTLGYRLPDKQVREGADMRSQLMRIGVLRETGHEHLSGSIVVPVISESGEVLEMYGRKVRDDLRKGTPSHLYLSARPDGRRGVFNLAGMRGQREVIVCEALLDALTVWQAGFRNVTSAYGVEGFTAEMRSALLEIGVKRVLVAYDRDDAGDRAAEKLARDLGAAGLEVFRVLFPRGMDANEYALAVQPAPKSMAAAIRGARRMAGSAPVTVVETIEESPEALPSELAKAEAETIEPASAAPTLDAVSATSEHADVSNHPNTLHVEGHREDTHESAVKASASDEVPAEVAASSSSAATAGALPAVALLSLLGSDVKSTDDELRVTLGDRAWRVRGLAKRTTYDSLRANILIRRDEAFFLDTVELNHARQRAAFVRDTAAELKIEEATIKSDLGKILGHLESMIEARVAGLVKPERPEMTAPERDEAMALLRDPNLRDRILGDFDRVGVVGEETNKLIGYLAATSRKLEWPLAVVIQSSSAAGKSSLMDAILRFMPEDERVQYSAMTGQSLYYMGETNLSHKILAIAEEHGAQSASYALKLLQSEGELRIACTGKDESGELSTRDRHVEGPVMIFMTTTAIEVDEELLNRCLILTVDEGTAQTIAIHALQRRRKSLVGLLERRERDSCLKVHQNAQRLLEALPVVNPYVENLRFASHTPRTRRDHMKYLTLIDAIALLYQYQREVKTVMHRGERVRYIEVTETDIALADELAATTLKQCLDDMPPQTRRLLESIVSLVDFRAARDGIARGAVRFSRRDLRDATRLGNTQLRMHLERLEELEYLEVHGGGGRRRTVYGLGYDGGLGGVERPLGGGVGGPLAGGASAKIFAVKPSVESNLGGDAARALKGEVEKAGVVQAVVLRPMHGWAPRQPRKQG